jgi:hypothetical protein
MVMKENDRRDLATIQNEENAQYEYYQIAVILKLFKSAQINEENRPLAVHYIYDRNTREAEFISAQQLINQSRTNLQTRLSQIKKFSSAFEIEFERLDDSQKSLTTRILHDNQKYSFLNSLYAFDKNACVEIVEVHGYYSLNSVINRLKADYCDEFNDWNIYCEENDTKDFAKNVFFWRVVA